MTDSVIDIRPLSAADRRVWETLWTGYLDFYNAKVSRETYDTTWSRLLHTQEPMHGLCALRDGKVEGIVHYVYHRSCWTIGDYCYLQDLFVSPAARKGGIGRALIEAVYRDARAAGASRVYWLTQEHNTTARALYDKLADRPGFTVYRHLF